MTDTAEVEQTEEEKALREKVAQQLSTRPPKPGPPAQQVVKVEPADPYRFINMATRAVVDNFNAHRDKSRDPKPLPYTGVYIVWFSKTLANWKAIVASPIIRGLLWEVTYNGRKQELYLDVYKKLSNVKVAVEEESAGQA